MFEPGGVAGKLAQAHALLAEVAVEISSELSGPAAAEALADTFGLVSQGELVTCLLSERVDRSGYFATDDALSMGAWVRHQTRCSEYWASARVGLGRALIDRLPASLKAWQAGQLTLEHAAVIQWATNNRPEGLVAALDEALAGLAGSCTPKELRDIAAELVERLDPEGEDKRRQRKTADQSAHLSDTLDGGRLDANLDAEGTAILRAALDKYMDKPQPTEGPDGQPQPPLPASHRRALALVEMARQALDFGDEHPGSANKPHLILTMDEQNLRDRSGLATTPDGSTLTAGVVRRLACDAKVIPMVLGSDSLPLDIGRTSRTVPPHIRIALNHRDKHCQAPGCKRPASWCDAHHWVHWIDGGETALINLILLCRKHHTMHHNDQLKIERLPNGRFKVRYLRT